jgi:hypothetical protein
MLHEETPKKLMIGAPASSEFPFAIRAIRVIRGSLRTKMSL